MASGGFEVSEGGFSTVHRQGHAVFIVNIEPKGRTGDFEFQTRLGANEDVGSLQTVFSANFGFEWINRAAHWHENLPLGRWDHRKDEREPESDAKECCLLCHIQSLDHSGSRCFVLAISSHGRELTQTEIIFSDGQSLPLTEIFDALSDEKCPSLKGIPRVIILQACRSSSEDKETVERMQDRGCCVNVEVQGNGRDLTSEGNETDIGAEGNDTVTADDPPMTRGLIVDTNEDFTFQYIALNKMPENFLLVYPCVSGQRSQRSEKNGSWLIYTLNKVLEQKYCREGLLQQRVNFFHLLTDVAGSIAKERETIAYEHEEGTKDFKIDESGKKIIDKARSGVKNAVCYHHRLLQPLVFYPKVKEEVEIPPIDFTQMFGGMKKKKTKKNPDDL